ncbi:MAG: hypothetical protein KDB24_03110, partial [Microthrixaceae bacterium]|nr:hypothetical protein [Microthrixaceae bacterium]
MATLLQPTHRPLRAGRVRLGLVCALGAVVALASLAAGSDAGATPSAPVQEVQGDCGDAGCVTVVAVSGLVDPLVADGIIEQLDEALASDKLVGVVLQIDSPGVVLSDAEFTNLARRLDRFSEKLAIWVGPSGAEAGGGSAELVALSPDSSIAPGSTLRFDRTQRLSADEFGTLVPADGDLVDVGIEADDAQQAGLVGEVAATLGDALVGLDWFESRVVTVDGEQRQEPVTVVRFVKLDLPRQLLHTAASPAVAYLAFIIGLGLLVFEFYTAGVGVAGVVGAGSLLLGGYGLGVLPVRSWAVALLVASMLAFAVDVQTGIPRFWAGAGMVAFTIGSLALFDGVPFPWIAVVVGL